MKLLKPTLFLSALLLCASGAQAQFAGGRAALPGARLLDRIDQQRSALLAELALTPAQEAALAEVNQARSLFRMQLALDVGVLAQRVRADLENPNANLRATVSAIQSTVDREIAAHRTLTEARLDFYDTLDATQQAQIRAELARRLAALEQLRIAFLALTAQ